MRTFPAPSSSNGSRRRSRGRTRPRRSSPLPPAPADPATPLRFSLAGVQLKFSAAARRDGRGLVIPAGGQGGDWIVKLADGRFPRVPANEWSMLTWAQACGVSVPEHRLLTLDDVHGLPPEVSRQGEREVLAVRRFDRGPGGRRHLEDFAQVLGVWPEQRYEGVNFETLTRLVDSITGGEDVAELLRRLVLMVAMGNGDAHLKNWSLLYVAPRRARLSPAYDLVSTGAYVPGDGFALRFAGTHRFENVDRRRFRALLGRAEVDERLLAVVAETAERARATWTALRGELPCAEEVKTTVDAQLRDVPLFGG